MVGDDRWDLGSAASEVMYQPYSQIPDKAIRMVSQLGPAAIAVRTKPGVAPLSVSRAVQDALLARDTRLPTSKVQTMEQVMMGSTAETNFLLLLLGIFAAMALLLAAVGIYGVMSYSVEQRRHEVGIRMALGGRSADVLRLVVEQGFKLTLIGVAAGIAGALGLTRFLAGSLYGVKPTDPLTFVAVSGLLTTVALLACYIPARRATKVDPMVALRLSASQQAVVGVGKREQGKQGEGLPATRTKSASDPNPVVMFIVGLLATATVANDGIAFANRASPQHDLVAVSSPIGFELVWRGRKWDKENRGS